MLGSGQRSRQRAGRRSARARCSVRVGHLDELARADGERLGAPLARDEADPAREPDAIARGELARTRPGIARSVHDALALAPDDEAARRVPLEREARARPPRRRQRVFDRWPLRALVGRLRITAGDDRRDRRDRGRTTPQFGAGHRMNDSFVSTKSEMRIEIDVATTDDVVA